MKLIFFQTAVLKDVSKSPLDMIKDPDMDQTRFEHKFGRNGIFNCYFGFQNVIVPKSGISKSLQCNLHARKLLNFEEKIQFFLNFISSRLTSRLTFNMESKVRFTNFKYLYQISIFGFSQCLEKQFFNAWAVFCPSSTETSSIIYHICVHHSSLYFHHLFIRKSSTIYAIISYHLPSPVREIKNR